MEENKDFTLMLFDRDLTAHYHFLIQTLKYASQHISTDKRSFDKQAILGIAMIQIIMIQTLMQYIEAVGAYCLACQKTSRKEFTDMILKYRTKDIHDFYSRIESLTDEELNNILSYCSPSLWTLKSNQEQITGKIKESITQLKEKLLELSKFWNKYHGFYNASKHGGRYWLYEFRSKETDDKYIGIQWLEKEGDIRTELSPEVNKFLIEIVRLADEARSIMKPLHANRVLIWSSDGKVNPKKYRYVEKCRQLRSR